MIEPAELAKILAYLIEEADGRRDDCLGGRIETPEMERARALLRELDPPSPAGASSQELDITQNAVAMLARSQAAKLEAVIHAGLRAILGEVPPMDQVGRLTVTVQGKWRTYRLDGEPFLRVVEGEPAMSDDYRLTASFEYAFLGRAAGAKVDL
jgi:hypothetical protein